MPTKNKNTVREWFDTIFYGGLIAIIFRSFLLEPFNIPSGSMIPSLHVGDHIFVQKWSYGYSRFSFPFGSWNLWDGRFWAKHEPDTGDIIVFRKPNGNVEYVKTADTGPESWLEDLYRRGVTSVMVEGGAVVLQGLIDAGAWDEARIEVSPRRVGQGVAAPVLQGRLVARYLIDGNAITIFRK